MIQPAGNVWAGYPELHRILSRKAGRMGDREPDDVAGEAIRRALQHPQAEPALRACFSGATRPEEWSHGRLIAFLLTTVRNIVFERLRAKRKLPEVPLESLNPDNGRGISLADLPKSPLEAVLARERKSLLADGLSSIPEINRLALLLFESGKSYQEIAEILGCAPGNVGSCLTRARQELRRHLSAPLSRPEKEKK